LSWNGRFWPGPPFPATLAVPEARDPKAFCLPGAQETNPSWENPSFARVARLADKGSSMDLGAKVVGPGTGNATRTVEMFDPATGEWSRMASATQESERGSIPSIARQVFVET
jgi:hypothetical protein